MTDAIALALIERLVGIGVLDAGDITAMADKLPEQKSDAVKAAWAYGLCPNGGIGGPVLRVVK